MYRKCTTEKTAFQQKQFEKVLLESMLEMPYKEITVSELCRKTGLTRNIFYRLFEEKDDVLYALLDHTIMEFSTFAANTQTKNPNLQQLEAFLIYWDHHRNILDALDKNEISNRLIERTFFYALNENGEFLRHLNVAPEDGQTEKALFAINGLISTIVYWHHVGNQKSPMEKAAALFKLITEPMVDMSAIAEQV